MRKFSFFTVLLLVLSVAGLASAQQTKTGRIAGRWATTQGAMSGGLAYFFNAATGPVPSYNRYWRIPDEIADLDSHGQFKAELLPGKYYLGLIKRVKGKEIGPPTEGDFFYFSTDANGKAKLYAVKKKGTAKIGTITEGAPFKREPTDTLTSIEGTVTNVEGKPVQGMLVFAFLTPAMVGRPMFVSDRTGADGKYVLRVNEGGTFYLKARENYGGGQPVVGELVGGYLDQAPTPVKVTTSATTKGIDLKAVKFVGRGPKRNR